MWEANKGVGAEIAPILKELVVLRNEMAKQLGFKNFHALYLHLNEQDGDELIKLFDDLDQLTREPFIAAKKDIDERLALKYGVKTTDLMPWHYHDPFFQESPAVFAANLDAPYAKADILNAVPGSSTAGIGLPIDDVLARSDLREKKGKSQHAFCTDIDREGDVRVLANIVENEYWMETTAARSWATPFTAARRISPIGVALRVCAARPTSSPPKAWPCSSSGSPSPGPGCKRWASTSRIPRRSTKRPRRSSKNQLLIFSRWCQVMLRFEKGMYENPDQDLNKLWWDLVEKYQMLQRPKDRDAPGPFQPDPHRQRAGYSTHNCAVGPAIRLRRCTFMRPRLRLQQRRIGKRVLYIGDKKVGDFMKKKVFEPGKTLNWKDLTKFATGSELSPKAFAADFKDK